MSANPYLALKKLLPTQTKQVGQIVAKRTGGTLEIESAEGGRQIIAGDGNVGDYVFHQGGRVTGAAPNLSPINILVSSETETSDSK